MSAALSADVIIFNQGIRDNSWADFHDKLRSIQNPKESVFFILVTYGGDAHAAYRIARELQLRYKRIFVCIAGDCYSAGTLMVLCANELVIGDRGNLGPLDVQILKKDELWEQISGLAVKMSVNELNTSAAAAVISIVAKLKDEYGPQLSFKTALELAVDITSHTFGEIYKQIDPIRIGEDARALRIASHYGNILGRKAGNLKPGTVTRLLENYPSHECIIDREEAGELFKSVRPPSELELALLEQLSILATDAAAGPLIACLSETSSPKEATHEPGDSGKPIQSDEQAKEKNGSGDMAPAARDDGKPAESGQGKSNVRASRA